MIEIAKIAGSPGVLHIYRPPAGSVLVLTKQEAEALAEALAEVVATWHD